MGFTASIVIFSTACFIFTLAFLFLCCKCIYGFMEYLDSRKRPQTNPTVFIVSNRRETRVGRRQTRGGGEEEGLPPGAHVPPPLHTPPPAYSVLWPGDLPRAHGAPDSFAPPSYNEAIKTSTSSEL